MEIQEAAMVSVVMGLTEATKRMGLPAKYAPLVSIALGVGLSLAVGGLSLEKGLMGVLWGLSASGLWSGGKALAGK